MESLAEGAELALSLQNCYIMELGVPNGVEMNFLMKKRYTILYYMKLKQFSILLLYAICPQMTYGISKFQTLLNDIIAHHRILGIIE